MNYLKDKQYYSDLYDLHTIKICIEWAKQAIDRCNKDEAFLKFPKNEQVRAKNILVEMPMYYKKGERYRDREKTISDWMEKDGLEQEKYNNAVEPQSVFCPVCNWAMGSEGKTLHNFSDEPMRVLFFFRCPKCRKGRGIFDDGQEFILKKALCPKCKEELKDTQSRKGEIITTISKCKCGYKNKDVWDMKAESDDHKKKEEHDRQLLVKYRTECCLSKEDGDRYLSDQATTMRFLKNEKERKVKEADPKYQKAKNLKKIKVSELQKLIEETITVSGYDSLNFDKPEIDRHIIISFSVQDTNTNRSDYDASRDLRRSLTKALETTNWRLMSDGVGNRLGLLYGRVKGYENEDDLMKII